MLRVEQALVRARGRISVIACVGLALCGSAWAQAVNITPPNLSAGVAGALKGSASATLTGASTYNIALPLPPGTAGVQPQLSLSYSSQTEDGWLGRGWTLSGLSAITRCPKTLAQDGVRRGVALNNEDQYCLDGQRLVSLGAVSGTETGYRTEIDGFSRIVSTRIRNTPADGPALFTVETKDGMTLAYGLSVSARIEAPGSTAGLYWLLDHVEDRRGNYYEIDYLENNAQGEYYPTQIRYTGNGAKGLNTYAAVRFSYETRPDPWSGYVMGKQLRRTVRMTAIKTYVGTDAAGNGGTLVRDFRLEYQQGLSSGRSLLWRVQDCDAQGTCLPATELAWTTRDPASNASGIAGSGYWGGPNINIEFTPKQPIPSEQVKAKTVMGDFNGDGAVDLLYADGSSAWKVCLSTGTAFNCQTWSAVAGRTEESMSGDFNGDGLTDIALLPSQISGIGPWTICLSTGSGFSCQTWNAQSSGKFAQRYMVADMDGDGRDDLLVYNLFNDNFLCRSNGAGFDPCVAYANLGAALSSGDDYELRTRVYQRIGDLNGDGRPDILKYAMRTGPSAGNAQWEAYVATDTGFVMWPSVAASVGSAIAPVQPGQSVMADINRDPFGAYSDTMAAVGTGNPNAPVLEVCKSTGTSLSCSTRPISPSTQSPVDVLADNDRDGWVDSYSTGRICQIGDTAFAPCTALPGGVPPGFYLTEIIADLNGDGIPDRAYYDNATLPGRWYVTLTAGANYQDLLASVTEGRGATTRFFYEGLENRAVHTPGPLLPYPSRLQLNGQAILSRMELSNGIGGWHAFDYRYQGAAADLRGRGSLGFSKVTAIDQDNGITTTTLLRQDFPYIGATKEVRRTSRSGGLLSLQTLGHARLDTGSGTVYPYIKTQTVTANDLDGSPLLGGSSTIDTVDAYGNVTHATEVVSGPDGESVTTVITREFENRDVYWLLGLKTKEQVTKTSTPAGSPVVPAQLTLGACVMGSGTLAPTPDQATCRLGNLGQTAATGIVYTSPSGTTVSGPTSCAAGSGDCGGVVVTSGTSPRRYDGQVTATSSSGSVASAAVTLQVAAPASPARLTLSACSIVSFTTTPTPATHICQVANEGESAASAISYASIVGATIVGPTGRCEAGTICGIVTVTSATTPGHVTGTLAVTPATGVGASMSIDLWVLTASQLEFRDCTRTSPVTAPASARLSCTVFNAGQTSITAIAYGGVAGASITGPTGACAATSSCGVVSVTTPGTAGTYDGVLTATPNAGGGAQLPLSLVVQSQAQLAWSNCSANSPVTTPNAATLSCTLSNTGQASANSISYGGIAGASVSGPTGACAGGTVCGTAVVTTSGNAGNYVGTLTASPDSGGSASNGVNLWVYTQAQLAFSNCGANSPTIAPTPASLSCTMTNVGQTATAAISYSAIGGASVTGPTGACGAGAVCGTVTVTTSGSAGNYGGTLIASPQGGVAGSTGVSLTVHPPPPSLTTTPVFPQSFVGKGLFTYTVTATANVANGLAPFVYQWIALQSNNTSTTITGGNTATATLATRQTVACEWGSAVYRVTVTDALNRVTSLDLAVETRSTSPPNNSVCP
ncbi:FG-GAP-like repeat-containing protein [Roseateles sp. L2-2]|uniref:FG-GAP-like repeat-containing protein n=1 Tax=Roseateles sp. L2-2 TaxID=3422597 RepID=UPI003D35E2ED